MITHGLVGEAFLIPAASLVPFMWNCGKES